MTSIKLLGVPSISYLRLRENLSKALEAIEVKLVIEEVNVIDEIISYEVGAIPAILIDNQIRFEKNGPIPDIKELTNLLNIKI